MGARPRRPRPIRIGFKQPSPKAGRVPRPCLHNEFTGDKKQSRLKNVKNAASEIITMRDYRVTKKANNEAAKASRPDNMLQG